MECFNIKLKFKHHVQVSYLLVVHFLLLLQLSRGTDARTCPIYYFLPSTPPEIVHESSRVSSGLLSPSSPSLACHHHHHVPLMPLMPLATFVPLTARRMPISSSSSAIKSKSTLNHLQNDSSTSQYSKVRHQYPRRHHHHHHHRLPSSRFRLWPRKKLNDLNSGRAEQVVYPSSSTPTPLQVNNNNNNASDRISRRCSGFGSSCIENEGFGVWPTWPSFESFGSMSNAFNPFFPPMENPPVPPPPPPLQLPALQPPSSSWFGFGGPLDNEKEEPFNSQPWRPPDSYPSISGQSLSNVWNAVANIMDFAYNVYVHTKIGSGGAGGGSSYYNNYPKPTYSYASDSDISDTESDPGSYSSNNNNNNHYDYYDYGSHHENTDYGASNTYSDNGNYNDHHDYGYGYDSDFYSASNNNYHDSSSSDVGHDYDGSYSDFSSNHYDY